jgi:PAP2 superfamily
LSLPRLLFGLAISLVAIDAVWAKIGHFHIDINAYSHLALLSLGLFIIGLVYQKYRPDPALVAMLMGASFLTAFSAAASVLNYFLLTEAGSRIDDLLVAADRMLGFDWYRMMVAMADHPLLNAIFFQVYNFVLPEIALLVVTLAWIGQSEKVYRFCLAVAAGALIAIAIWTITPSLGAKSLYTLPPGVEHRLLLSVTTQYGRELVALLHNGPGFITPNDLRGLIAFPSYHAVLALIVVWYARSIPWLRWPLLAINLVVLVCTPEQGGHHLIDVLAAFPVTALALAIAESRKLTITVNQLQTGQLALPQTGWFRSAPAQKRSSGPVSD